MLIYCDSGENGIQHLAWTETSLTSNIHQAGFDGQFGLNNFNDGHWHREVFRGGATFTELWFSFFHILLGDTGDGTPTPIRIFTWESGGTELGSVRWQPVSKFIQIFRQNTLMATGTFPYSHGSVGAQWRNFNVRILLHGSTGSIEVYLEGNPIADCQYSGNTLPSGTSMDRFYMGAPGQLCGMRFDNVWVNDTTGAYNNGRPGAIRSYTQRPISDSAVNNAWNGSGGGTKANLVNENVTDDANYVYSEVLGDKQGFVYPAPAIPFANPQVKALVIFDLARKVSLGGMKQGIRIAGANYLGTAKTLPTATYQRDSVFAEIFEQNPATLGPWAGSENPESCFEKT